MEHRALLGDVDLLAREHRVAQLLDPGPAGQRDQQRDRLGGEPVLRVVEVEVADLEVHRLAAVGLVGEERPEMDVADGVEVRLERTPFGRVDDPGRRVGHAGAP